MTDRLDVLLLDLEIPFYEKGTAITQELIDIFQELSLRGWTAEQISERVGPSIPAIKSRLKYADDPEGWAELRKKKDVSPLKKKIRGFCKSVKGENFFTEEALLSKGIPTDHLTGERVLDLNDPSTYQLDHIKPRARGGEDTLDNCDFLLTKTNQAKGDMTNEEFVELCFKVVKHHLLTKVKSIFSFI